MRKRGWYVVQVQTGREQAMCHVISRACAEYDLSSDNDTQLLEECFSPQWRTRHKFHGEWRDVDKLLLPGYVIAVTEDPVRLMRVMRKVPEFTKLLAMGETFVPLHDEDRAWIDEWTTKGERIVPMSIAYKKGDALTVTEGPLKGREGIVTRVNRKKCLAYVELNVNGKHITTSVGLAIVGEEDTDTQGAGFY